MRINRRQLIVHCNQCGRRAIERDSGGLLKCGCGFSYRRPYGQKGLPEEQNYLEQNGAKQIEWGHGDYVYELGAALIFLIERGLWYSAQASEEESLEDLVAKASAALLA